MADDSLFFPKLQRRSQYSIKKNGEFYAYDRYKQEIREDCLGRCVYCDAHENESGGTDSMNLDHFRPQKYKEHQYLVNDPSNLVWSCAGCNRLKSDNWPALGTSDTVVGNQGFIDPFVEDRQAFFSILSDGELQAKKPPAEYVIRLLALNRFSRKRIRELRLLKQTWLQEFERQISELQGMLEAKNLTKGQEDFLTSHIDWLQSKKTELRKMFLDFSLH